MASQGQTPEQIEADQKAFDKWMSSFDGDYVGKEKKAAWWEQRNAPYRQKTAESALGGQVDPKKLLSGSAKEQEAQLSGMNLGNIAYGQGLEQTGKDISGLRDEYKSLSEAAGTDAISAAIMAQKGSDLTQAGRSMRQAGVKGGVAAGAMQDIANQSNAQVARSLYGQKSQALDKLRSFTGNTLAGQISLMKGEQAGGVQMPQAPSSGFFGTVICTELYLQGHMPLEVYTKDSEYGKSLPYEVILGYQFWAIPLVKLMKKSKLFTAIVKVPALSWANHIAGKKKSVFGYFCQKVAEPACGILGKALLTLGVKYVR